MAFRIVCLEEHILDPAIEEAGKPLIARAYPYVADQGSSYRDTPDPASGRPQLNAPQTGAALARGGVEERLGFMDDAGIDVQVLSYSHPAVVVTAQAARAANDRLAEIVARHPTRFAGFSTLPWGEPEAAAREAERCARDLGFCGSLMVGRPAEGVLIDDVRYGEVLAALAATGSPLYVHPGPPLPEVQRPYYSGFGREAVARLSLFGWGWHNEAGIQVIRLILSGAFDRLPALRIISGHWGELVPFYLQRLTDALPREVTGLERAIDETYRAQVWVTPSGMLDLPNFLFCREALGADRILFSLDYPYMTMTGGRAWLERLPASDDERLSIAAAAAERLMPALARTRP